MDEIDTIMILKYIKYLIVVLLLIAAACFGLGATVRIYEVWAQAKAGEAELAHAEWSRQIAVKEANAKKDSAHLLAESEIIRAEGMAKANKIIGDSLKNNEKYLQYLWVQTLDHSTNKIIYIPTEANLPILEARRKHE